MVIDLNERRENDRWLKQFAAAMEHARNDHSGVGEAWRRSTEAQAQRLRGKSPQQIVAEGLNTFITGVSDMQLGLQRSNTPSAREASEYLSKVTGYVLMLLEREIVPMTGEHQ
jgi:hypothetical protein